MGAPSAFSRVRCKHASSDQGRTPPPPFDGRGLGRGLGRPPPPFDGRGLGRGLGRPPPPFDGRRLGRGRPPPPPFDGRGLGRGRPPPPLVALAKCVSTDLLLLRRCFP